MPLLPVLIIIVHLSCTSILCKAEIEKPSVRLNLALLQEDCLIFIWIYGLLSLFVILPHNWPLGNKCGYLSCATSFVLRYIYPDAASSYFFSWKSTATRSSTLFSPQWSVAENKWSMQPGLVCICSKIVEDYLSWKWYVDNWVILCILSLSMQQFAALECTRNIIWIRTLLHSMSLWCFDLLFCQRLICLGIMQCYLIFSPSCAYANFANLYIELCRMIATTK